MVTCIISMTSNNLTGVILSVHRHTFHEWLSIVQKLNTLNCSPCWLDWVELWIYNFCNILNICRMNENNQLKFNWIIWYFELEHSYFACIRKHPNTWQVNKNFSIHFPRKISIMSRVLEPPIVLNICKNWHNHRLLNHQFNLVTRIEINWEIETVNLFMHFLGAAQSCCLPGPDTG